MTSDLRVEKKERARLKTVKFNAKSRDRGVSVVWWLLLPWYLRRALILVGEGKLS